MTRFVHERCSFNKLKNKRQYFIGKTGREEEALYLSSQIHRLSFVLLCQFLIKFFRLIKTILRSQVRPPYVRGLEISRELVSTKGTVYKGREHLRSPFNKTRSNHDDRFARSSPVITPRLGSISDVSRTTVLTPRSPSYRSSTVTRPMMLAPKSRRKLRRRSWCTGIFSQRASFRFVLALGSPLVLLAFKTDECHVLWRRKFHRSAFFSA